MTIKSSSSPLLLAIAALAPSFVQAQVASDAPQSVTAPVEQTLERCALLGDPTNRLACYDALAKRAPVSDGVVVANGGAQAASPATARTGVLVDPDASRQAAAAAPAATQVSHLVPLWELDAGSKRGVFNIRPHRDTYLLLANYSNSINDGPFKEYTPAGIKSKHVELMYQLSFKMKAMETIAGSPVDLWFGYTQQSFWQAYNRSASSPFRETNYQPEVMAVVPIGKRLGGFDFRYASLGVVHQSNGQTATLSRSWNRLYGEVGGEYGKLAVTARIWKRLDNDKSDNDNLDIADFMGHGDVRVSYRDNGTEYSLLARRNFHTKHGAVQLGWAAPIRANLKGYLQFFSGMARA
ncbi:phospholipase A [Pseudoduganella chitinolytica]|uniref:Phospholipase A1 n=1 Tax=Pseudoduganella chitinolytica TaxID=34070 RepID=A0ABY8BFH5_9BURK|nr:phospholipase A [Pseudoduganella chitinolytica]WEF34570.1 phospholipase A [Pseudoduganella chitinolytica]